MSIVKRLDDCDGLPCVLSRWLDKAGCENNNESGVIELVWLVQVNWEWQRERTIR
jgi:hypothetical protein